MDKIQSLTPEQDVMREKYRKDYLAHGWSSQPADRPTAEKAMTDLYARLNQSPPKFLWVDSPYAAQEIIRASGKPPQQPSVRGGIDAYWVCRFVFAQQAFPGIFSQTDAEHLAVWDTVIKSTGYVYPFTKICIMCERPSVLSRNERNVLHCEDGPAIAFRDGHPGWYWDGLEVTQQIIEAPHTLTLEQIEGMTENTDVQTVAQERWCHEDGSGAGGGRWLEETGAELVHQDDYLAYGNVRMARALLKDKRGFKYLVCTDSCTDRVYYIRSSPDAKTCEEAHMSFNGGIRDSEIVFSG